VVVRPAWNGDDGSGSMPGPPLHSWSDLIAIPPWMRADVVDASARTVAAGQVPYAKRFSAPSCAPRARALRAINPSGLRTAIQRLAATQDPMYL